MTMRKLTTFVTKGFTVPEGSRLVITQPNGNVLVKDAGEYSGGRYTLDAVKQGLIPGWSLTVAPLEVSMELGAILDDLAKASASVLFVGGVVRDRALGVPNKDVDIEVYGMEPEALSSLLEHYGKVDQVGASFGVIKLTTTNDDYDFSLPRRESKEGKGHRGFMVSVDPNLPVNDALSRRDFTINAMGLSPSGELVDPYGGFEDLNSHTLRHTSPAFAEDALRVLRGMQFAARYNMTMAPETIDLCKQLKPEYEDLAVERVWGEWEKWAVKGKSPSMGLAVLKQTGWIDLYPELKAMVGIKQEKEWHPEGPVDIHTEYVCDSAAKIADREKMSDRDRTILLFAALCHDMGKPSTTVVVDGEYHAPGHAAAGAVPTESFLRSIGAPEDIIQNVVPLVEEHMSHLNARTPRSVRRLALRVFPSNLKMLSYVMEADYSGRPPLPEGLPEDAKEMLRIAHELALENKKPTPLVNGRDLMDLAKSGMLPPSYATGGVHFGRLLSTLFEDQLEGRFETLEEGKQYAVDLFSTPSSKDAMIRYINTLNVEGKEKLVEEVNARGMSLEELFSTDPSLLMTSQEGIIVQ